MELGLNKANSCNLPEIRAVMLGEFVSSSSDLRSLEFCNVKKPM